MVVCPQRFDNIAFYRTTEYPSGGVLADFVSVAKNLALKDGKQKYCGYYNTVTKDSWSGGVIGLKTILKSKSRDDVFSRLELLSEYGYLHNVYNESTKELYVWSAHNINRPIKRYLPDTQCFSTNRYGYILLNRDLGDKLTDAGYTFTDGDAYIDLILHTVIGEHTNPFSYLAPTIMYENNSMLTLDYLGSRWNWEKTKVHRFFKKYSSVFALRKCPGNFGSVIFTNCQTEIGCFPSQSDVAQIVRLCLRYNKRSADTSRHYHTINNLMRRAASRIMSHIRHGKHGSVYRLFFSFYRSVCVMTIKNTRNDNNVAPLLTESPNDDETTPCNYFDYHPSPPIRRMKQSNFADYIVDLFFLTFNRPPDFSYS